MRQFEKPVSLQNTKVIYLSSYRLNKSLQKCVLYEEIQYIILIFHFAVLMSCGLLKATVWYGHTMTAKPAHQGNFCSLWNLLACY